MKKIPVISSILLLALTACAGVQGVRTAAVDPGTISGVYSVVLMEGTPIPGRVTRIAILDVQGDAYTITPDERQFGYKLLRDLPAQQAIETAREFVGSSPALRAPDLQRISAPDGNVIGYELKPGYTPYGYGGTEALSVNYRIDTKGDVRVSVTVEPSVQKELAS